MRTNLSNLISPTSLKLPGKKLYLKGKKVPVTFIEILYLTLALFDKFRTC